jgi:hypothetical protein
MIIKAITIENFKGIREPVRVEFKPITLLFGPNSAGKSTIVQALHYAREILERNNVDADRSVGADDSFDLGGFRNLVHNHNLSHPMRLSFELSIPNGRLPDIDNGCDYDEIDNGSNEYYLTGMGKRYCTWDITEYIKTFSAEVTLEISWSNLLNKPYVSCYSTRINDHEFAKIMSSADCKRIRVSKINFEHPSFLVKNIKKYFKDYSEIELQADNITIFDYLFDQVINGTVVNKGHDMELGIKGLISALPGWNKNIKISESCYANKINEYSYEVLELEGYLNQLLVCPGKMLLEQLNKFRYIGPIRKTPPRNYSPFRSADETRWSSGLAAWDLLYSKNSSFINHVNKWLAGENHLNTGYHIRLKRYKELDVESPVYNAILSNSALLDDINEIQDILALLPEKRSLSLVEEQRHLEVQPHDVGIGISQVLPVVIAALDDKAELVMIEQPELHIHPGLQTALGDLFISQVESGCKSFLLETHSEHLLLRLLRRIRETNDDELPPDTSPLTPDQVSVNYVEPTDKGLRIRQLLISSDGDSFGEWPNGFFEERAKELL